MMMKGNLGNTGVRMMKVGQTKKDAEEDDGVTKVTLLMAGRLGQITTTTGRYKLRWLQDDLRRQDDEREMSTGITNT